MRVFVTGATGFVGSVVVNELRSAGHEVLGLVRSDATAKALAAAGGEVLMGSLEDLAALKRGAAECDAVIHTAFIHDFTKFAENCATDRRAIETIGAVLQGTRKPLLVTSGVATIAQGRPSTEDDAAPPVTEFYPRASEAAALELAARSVHASVVRLPPTVHGEGDKGFVPMLIAIAREKGVSAYIGDGHNRWPAVHRRDAAAVYCRAIEIGAKGARYNAVAEEGIALKDIATVIGRHLGVPIASKSPQEAPAHFGWFGAFAGFDVPTSSAKTRKILDWQPKQPTLLADMEHAGYF